MPPIVGSIFASGLTLPTKGNKYPNAFEGNRYAHIGMTLGDMPVEAKGAVMPTGSPLGRGAEAIRVADGPLALHSAFRSQGRNP